MSVVHGAKTTARFAIVAESRIGGLYFLGLPWQHTRGSALLG
jgi:hypothetical protein